MGTENISEKSILEIDNLITEMFRIKNSDSLPLKSDGVARAMLPHLFRELGYKTGAEIGVLRGAYSMDLCQGIPGLKLKCIDPWAPFRRNSVIRMEGHFIRTRKRLRGYHAEIIRKPSMEAVREIPDKSLDFVYIDAMHEFDPVMLDLIFWSDKVRPGGIISGHDYSEPSWHNGVMFAVDTYTKAHNIKKWYITDEEDKSFFWVKS